MSHSRTDVAVRDLRTTIDEPAERGGTNHIDLVTAADAAAVEKLKRELQMFCPVSKVFRGCAGRRPKR